MNHHRKIADALNKELWSTDLFMPRFHSGEVGPWRIVPGGQLVNDWGYYTGPCLVEMQPSLARRVESRANANGHVWETWMSLTPHEIESQELACRHAFGHTVIMGLGMGWIAANVALNPRVTRVTVVEIDADVIALFRQSGALASVPESAKVKIEIVNGNAMDWSPSAAGRVDFLVADIWLRLAEPATLDQVRRMQNNIKARQIYYWGQEIAIYCAARERTPSGAKITARAGQSAVDKVIGLPLLIARDRDYAGMIQQVIDNRLARGLTTEVPVV